MVDETTSDANQCASDTASGIGGAHLPVRPLVESLPLPPVQLLLEL